MSTTFRTAHRDELALLSDWAAAEGWNPGLDDMSAFHAADPDGFFVAETNGRPVAAISVVTHSDSFAFLGFYLCLPEFRGQGIGFALWNHALAHAGARTVGLDGVADQEANYARSGFARAGATVRFAGKLSAQDDPRIRPATAADLPAIARLDAKATGVERPAFLAAWTKGTDTRRSVVLNDGAGFATIRQCRDGVKIGPVLAANSDDAMALMQACLAIMPSDTVFVDLPDDNHTLIKSLTDLGFAPTFHTARMYRGAAPVTTSLQQAIATMELG